MKGSIVLGIASGAATGFVLGPVLDRGASGAKLGGSLIGAAVGGVAGYLIHKSLDERDSGVRKETLFNLDKYNVSHPGGAKDYDYGIAAPSVETECFDTEIKGDKLVQAHCESRITGTPEWVKNTARKKTANE